jgi:carbohydrate kinase (thermoresistant glucokinase family)
MGVSGAGKSVVGAALAQALGVRFVEGDDYHSAESVRKMASGTPLTDADRAGWLRALAALIADARADARGFVLSCSALTRGYRDVLRGGDAQLRFVFLRGDATLLAERMAARHGHFMPASLLASQLATLQEPDAGERAIVCDIAWPPAQLVSHVVASLASAATSR